MFSFLISFSYSLTYIVKTGDSLSLIASKYGTSISSIAQLNKINNPNLIYVGQILQIPSSSSNPQQKIVSSSYVYQYDSRFNKNIQNYGCAFMSLCYLGGINSIEGCTNQYNRAINNGWMRSDCYIYSWDSMKFIANAKYFKWADRNYNPKSNEKEILQCHTNNGGMHFVVGNGKGGIEYDPARNFVTYSQRDNKRIYGY